MSVAVPTAPTAPAAPSAPSPLDPDVALFNQTKAAVLLFDQIFAQISPCRKYNDNIREPALEISLACLSDAQCQAISHLSGYFTHIYDEMERRFLEKLLPSSALAGLTMAHPAPYPTTTLSHTQLLTKVHLLQDFLVNELVRAEELEQNVSRLEEKLVQVNESNTKLQKKLKKAEIPPVETRRSVAAGHSPNGGAPATPAVSAATSTGATPASAASAATATSAASVVASTRKSDRGDPQASMEAKLGRFIRKPFSGKHYFGLVANYAYPYFQIVYEDADFEDADVADVLKYTWTHDVPTSKRVACFRHAETKGKLHASLLDRPPDADVHDHTNASAPSVAVVAPKLGATAAVTTSSSASPASSSASSSCKSASRGGNGDSGSAAAGRAPGSALAPTARGSSNDRLLRRYMQSSASAGHLRGHGHRFPGGSSAASVTPSSEVTDSSVEVEFVTASDGAGPKVCDSPAPSASPKRLSSVVDLTLDDCEVTPKRGRTEVDAR